MCLFRRKKKQPIQKSLSRLADLAVQLEVLVYLASDDYKKTLNPIVDIVKYMPPSGDPQAIKIENMLYDWFDDLKIQFSGRNDAHKIDALIQKIEVALIERKAYR